MVVRALLQKCAAKFVVDGGRDFIVQQADDCPLQSSCQLIHLGGEILNGDGAREGILLTLANDLKGWGNNVVSNT